MKQRFITRIAGQRGFTILDLLIVVAIIGILASIAIPEFIGAREKALLLESKVLAEGVTRATLVYRVSNDKNPTDLAQLGSFMGVQLAEYEERGWGAVDVLYAFSALGMNSASAQAVQSLLDPIDKFTDNHPLQFVDMKQCVTCKSPHFLVMAKPTIPSQDLLVAVVLNTLMETTDKTVQAALFHFDTDGSYTVVPTTTTRLFSLFAAPPMP